MLTLGPQGVEHVGAFFEPALFELFGLPASLRRRRLRRHVHALPPGPRHPGQAPPRLAGPELLERAVDYTRGSLLLVAGTALDARTPCARWDLHALLRHMVDSLAAFTEAAEIGYVDLVPVRAGPGAIPSTQPACRSSSRR